MRLLPILALAGALLAGCDRRVAGGSIDGAAVFAAACASCHGAAGTPPEQMAALGVRDLAGAEFAGRRTRARILEQVRTGSPSGRMPAFAGALTEAQVQAVADHVMALSAR